MHPVRDEIDAMPPRPESPDIGAPQNVAAQQEAQQQPLDSIYDFDTDNDFWDPDDFPLKPIEPVGESQNLLFTIPSPLDQSDPSMCVSLFEDKEELKLDLDKEQQEVEVKAPVIHVPHKRDDIEDRVTKTCDVYWEKRRYGESLEETRAPASFLTANGGGGSDLESRSRTAFNRLLFDLTGEIICDTYAEEELPEPQPWSKPHARRRAFYKGRTPPTTSDELKPIVTANVLTLLNKDISDDAQLTSLMSTSASGALRSPRTSLRPKLIGRKKKDRVDEILIDELRAEEPEWVNYDADEEAVKMQLDASIWDSLLADTANIFSDVIARKKRRQQQEEEKSDAQS